MRNAQIRGRRGRQTPRRHFGPRDPDLRVATLLDAAEADTNETSRNILLGHVENLLHGSGWEPLLSTESKRVRLGRAFRQRAIPEAAALLSVLGSPGGRA